MQQRTINYRNAFYWLYILFLAVYINTSYSHPYDQSLKSYKWKRVTITSHKDFHYHPVHQNTKTPDCFKIREPNDHPILRCRIRISLLRTLPTIRAWQHIQKSRGYISLTLKDAGILNERSKIIAINSIKPNTENTGLTHKNSEFVTGIFKHPVLNARQYTFQSIKTGKISTINATPTHRFYVSNRKSFIPISHITATDRLITSTGEKVKLLCHLDGKTTCGAVYHKGEPVYVYNLEVNKKHTYFVGDYHILAHNIYTKRQKVKCHLTKKMIPKSQAVQIVSGHSNDVLNMLKKNISTLDRGIKSNQQMLYNDGESILLAMTALIKKNLPGYLEKDTWYEFKTLKRLIRIEAEKNQERMSTSPYTQTTILGLIDHKKRYLPIHELTSRTVLDDNNGFLDDQILMLRACSYFCCAVLPACVGIAGCVMGAYYFL